MNLNAIAAAVIGGTSLFGGRGSAYSALLGIIVIQSIASDENSALTVSMLTDDVEGVGSIALSLPRVIGRAGVVSTLLPTLDVNERALLRRSAATIEEALADRW